MGLCSVELQYGIVLETISLLSLAMTTLHRKLGQNRPIAQFTTLETRKGPKCVPHVFLGLLLGRISQLMANLFT